MKKFVLLSTLIFIANFAIANSGSSPKQGWNERMNKIGETMERLFPMLFDESEFEKPENQKVIQNDLNTLADLSHDLSGVAGKMKDSMAAESDVTFKLVSESFKDHLQRAAVSFEKGHQDYARKLAKESVGYCYYCHTSNHFGPQYHLVGYERQLPKLNEEEQGNYYVAIRNFNRAFTHYLQAVASPENFANDPFMWQRALRNAIALTVRVLDNPNLTEMLLTVAGDVSAKKRPSMATDIADWKAGLNYWKANRNKFKLASTESNYVSLLNTVYADIQKVTNGKRKSSAEIQWLLLSEKGTEFTRMYPKSDSTAQILLYLGDAASSLEGLGGLWMFQDLYYEECIHQKNHSATAMECYKKLKESIEFSYTGSRGLDVPSVVSSKLKKLNEEAQTKTNRN